MLVGVVVDGVVCCRVWCIVREKLWSHWMPKRKRDRQHPLHGRAVSVSQSVVS